MTIWTLQRIGAVQSSILWWILCKVRIYYPWLGAPNEIAPTTTWARLAAQRSASRTSLPWAWSQWTEPVLDFIGEAQFEKKVYGWGRKSSTGAVWFSNRLAYMKSLLYLWGRLNLNITRYKCGFQIGLNKLIHLKSTHPLWNTIQKSSTVCVQYSNGRISPSPGFLPQWCAVLDSYSIWNSETRRKGNDVILCNGTPNSDSSYRWVKLTQVDAIFTNGCRKGKLATSKNCLPACKQISFKILVCMFYLQFAFFKLPIIE